jgi:LuxR family maltose regulon positive regulatory protein
VICSYTGDLVGSITFAQQALDLLPATSIHVRASATMNTTLTYLLHGDATPAMERRVRAAIPPAHAGGNPFVFLRSISNLARLQVLQGQLHQAATTYTQAIQIAPEQAGLRVRISGAAYYCGFGDLMREWNDLEAADYLLTEGHKIIGETLLIDADVVILGYAALARLQQARGDIAQALATVDAGVRLAERRHFPTILCQQLRAIRAQVDLATGNLASARRWADSIASWIVALADYRYEPVALALARVRIAEQRNDPTTSVLPAILELLDQLLVDAEAKARNRSLVEILTLRALALDALANHASARAALERALQLAQSAGYVRLFLDEGAALVGLLRHAHTHSSTQSYVATLLAACGELPSALSGQHPGGLAEPLTERERDVLHLLVAGQSNAAIARALVVTVGTVKSHVNHIYGKLGVTSRSQAIARARALQLG